MGQAAGKEAEDPSMEDILASIRRILNDDEPASQATAHKAAADDGYGPVDQPALAEDEVFVLDQSMLVEQPPAAAPQATHAASAVSAPSPTMPPEPQTTFQQAPPSPMISADPDPSATETDDALLAPSTVAAASASMGALVRVVGQQQTAVYRGGPTLEDMVRDEIRPLVKSWLDEHLAPMVERMVRAEIARVTEGK